MSDSDLTQKTNFTQNQNTGSTQNLKDQMADAGAEMKQRASDALRASTDVARDKFKEAADAAKDVASGTVDQLQEQTRQQQRTGADFVERFAGNIREAARAFDNAPFAARGINSAAEYVGHQLSDFYADDNVGAEYWKRLMRGEDIYDYPSEVRCKDGSVNSPPRTAPRAG